jgi:hypothetical protein
VLPLMKRGGRIVVCGQMADYNRPAHEAVGLKNTRAFIGQRLTMRGLVAFDYVRQYPTAWERMTQLDHRRQARLPRRRHRRIRVPAAGLHRPVHRRELRAPRRAPCLNRCR